MKKPKVLIITANYGNGHVQVARALEEQFVLTGKAEVVVSDLYKETNPRLHEWTKKLYLKSYTSGGGQLYRLFYYGSQKISKRKHSPIFPYGFSELRKTISEEKPDVIINTFPTHTIPYTLLKIKKAIPIYNVVTDYCLHSSWVHPRIDKYFVATPDLQTQLIDNGVSNNKIVVSGIPVRNQFELPYSQQTLLNKYRLDPNLKTILMIAGAYGVSKEMEYILENLKADNRLQILIVCGKNNQLFEQLQMKYRGEEQIRIFGYVTNMAELLEVATCVVTKPGGITLSEAVVKKVPIVLPKATPGQEKENALYFQRNGAAISFERLDHLVEGTRQLVNDDRRLQQMKAALARIYFPHTAEKVINDILQSCDWLQAQKF